MRLHKSPFPRSLWKALNFSVVLALIVASFAPVIALAATDTPAQTVQTNGACEVSGNKIFLPLVSSTAKQLAAAVEGLFAAPEAIAPQVVERKLKYQVGKTYVYSYDITVISSSSERNTEGTTSSDQSKTVMAAQAELSITSQESDGTFSGQMVMNSPYVCSADLKNGTDSVADTADLSTELQKPILFKQKPNGEITSVTYPSTSRPAVVNMQKGVINALQNVLQDGATYSVAEVGGQGTFTPTYTLQEQNDMLNITKDYNDKSFSKLQKQGDDIKSLKLTSIISAVLDGPKGVFASVVSSEVLETGDGDVETENVAVDENGKQIFDGTTTWSTVNSSGKLSLKEIKTSTNLQAAALSDAYVEGGLEPIFEEPAANPQGIDLSKVNLTQEFADFEAAPTDPTKFSRILDLVAADTGEAVVDKIIERLNANASNDDIARSYIDMLTVISTPKAQTALSSLINPSIKAAGISATLSITAQEHALIDMVRIEKPISTTVDTVVQLSADSASELKNTAITVLGATINNLSDEDPNQAKTLADGLVGSLSSAALADKQIYLDALGNAGITNTLDAISQYTNITDVFAFAGAASLSEDTPITGTTVVTEVLEAAAYNALRKIPGAEAEGLLVAALADTYVVTGTRLLVADILKNRADLSGAGTDSLNSFLAGSGTYSRYWGSWLGNSNLGVHFPGSFTASNVGQYYLYADQQANGYVWGRSFQAARGQLVSYSYQANRNWQFVGAYLDLAGNRVVQREAWILCNQGYNGNLWASNWRWSYRVSIPIVWVITIDVEVKVTVNVNVDYTYGLNICNVNSATMYGEITPGANVVVTAEASLNLRLARGGIGIYAKVMDTRLPARLTLSFDGSTFRLCPSVRVNTNPLSGYIYAFADVGIDYWLGAYWERVWSGNLATFNVGTYNYNVFTTCW